MKNLTLLLLLFTQSLMAGTIIPFERETTRISEFQFMTSNNDTSDLFTNDFVGDEQEVLYPNGFSFQNIGPNKIVTPAPTGFDFAHRNFSFTSPDNSRRDTHVWITDYIGSGRVSDYFETMLVFLPRENLMHVEERADDILVTLTTGEQVIYSKKHKTIQAGVLKEEVMDLNPDRNLRKHVQLTYSGKGLMIRSDARGADPRIVATVSIIKKGLSPCQAPAKLFWTQDDFPKFKFVTDEEAYTVIAKYCGTQFL